MLCDLIIDGNYILSRLVFTLHKNNLLFGPREKLSLQMRHSQITASKNYLKVFDEEKLSNTKIITLALHPHIVGVPQNFYYLKKMIQNLKKREDVIFMTSSQIGDWYIKEEGSNGKELTPYLEKPPE